MERKNDDAWVKAFRDWRLLVGVVEAGVRICGENVLWGHEGNGVRAE